MRPTRDVIADTLQHELAGIAVELEARLAQPVVETARAGGWHAPIVMVDGKLLSQGRALNRGLLTQAVIDAASATTAVIGNHVFGKATCPHCKRARQYLDDAGIAYSYHDVVREPRALYEMLARVKPIIGAKTPVTVPSVARRHLHRRRGPAQRGCNAASSPTRSAGATPCRQPRAKRLWRAQVPLRVGRSAFALSNAFS